MVMASQLHAQHAVQVIENMLQMLKIQSTKLVLPTERFSPAELVSECSTLVRHLLAARKLQLCVHCDPTLPVLLGSPFHLKTVILNLLSK